MSDIAAYRSKRLRGIEARAHWHCAASDGGMDARTVSRPARPSAVAHHGGTDSCELYDPELSAVLGVAVGEVDRWEEGITEPTWVQVQALADLTHYPPQFFDCTDAPSDFTGGFVCARGHAGCRPFEVTYEQLSLGRWKIVADRPDAYRLPI